MTIAPLMDTPMQGMMMPNPSADNRTGSKGDFMQAFSNAKDSVKTEQPVKTEGAGAKGKESNNAAMDAAKRNRSINENRAQRVQGESSAQKAERVQESDSSAEEDVMATIASNAQQLLDDIMELLGDITMEGLDDALSALNMNMSDLLSGGAGNMLIAQLFGDGDLASLLADSDLSDMASKLSDLIADAMADMEELMPGENAERLMGPALNDAMKEAMAAGQGAEEVLADAVMPVKAAEEPYSLGQELGSGQQEASEEDGPSSRRADKREHAEFSEIREDQPAFVPGAEQDVQISAEDLKAQTEQLRYVTDPREILDQVADQIKTNVKEDMSSLEMVLHPASLGNVALNLTSKDGSVSAQFTAQSEAVKAALESQLQVLKENLEQAGVRVTSVEVTVGSHAFEQNLEQGNDGQSDAEAQEREKLRRATRRIDLGMNGEGDLEGIDDADAVTVEMMQADGNRMDHRV